MAIKFRNLDGYLQAAVAMDVGQVHYLVDSDFRTAAQGWSRADGTGPLDLWAQRNPGYVFRTADHANDALAAQAAIDAVVDERGDVVYATPGNYSIGTALAVNAIGMRLLGPPVRGRRSSRATITDTIGNGLDVTVADVEIGWLRFVPLTATNAVRMNAADHLQVHNFFWDVTGVAADTRTIGITGVTAASAFVEVYDSEFHVDAAQGEALQLALTEDFYAENCRFISKAGTWARAVLTAATTDHAHIARSYFGGEGALTTLFVGVAGADILIVTDCRFDGSAFTNVETGFDTTVAIELAENYTTGDSASQGGALAVLA